MFLLFIAIEHSSYATEQEQIFWTCIFNILVYCSNPTESILLEFGLRVKKKINLDQKREHECRVQN